MIIIIILVIIFGLIILRAVSNRTVIDPANTGWDELINDPNTDEMFLVNFKLADFSDIASKVLKPLSINYIKFMSNLFYIFYNGNLSNPFVSKDVKRFSMSTASIKNYKRIADRPRMPIWFIAAFPDVLTWINEGKAEILQILDDGVKEDALSSELASTNESTRKLEMYRVMIENYLKKVKPNLEVQ